ncbi:MAG: hypothetical protein M1587_05815, partial [Thaumarchaeota archaeon]|nr:hypothetical protein [Nitrososphaerota archaeon]
RLLKATASTRAIILLVFILFNHLPLVYRKPVRYEGLVKQASETVSLAFSSQFWTMRPLL